MFGFFKKATAPAPEAVHEAAPLASVAPEAPQMSYQDMYSQIHAGMGLTVPPEQFSVFAGDKWDNSFGPTQIMWDDYWTLRNRSVQLWKENLYVKGLFRRLLTNEINTGLTLEATVDSAILGMTEDAAEDWGENVENRLEKWAANKRLCDFNERRTFGQIQYDVRLESLLGGDTLVVLHQSRRSKLPQVETIPGGLVMTPFGVDLEEGHRIIEGVELDKRNRQVAYWVLQSDGINNYKRIPARGARTGRLKTWLVYGSENRCQEVRGTPLAANVLLSLKDLDRYRDAASRKAVINSILAMFIKKGEAKMGTAPITGGARNNSSTSVTDDNGNKREFNIASHHPGLVIEELQEGEEPIGFGGNGTDVNFGPYEEVIISAVAWSMQIPPEIAKLAFSSNYSASQAALQEFNMYLHLFRFFFGANFCQPIYEEYLIAEVLLDRVAAPGFLEAWRDVYMQYATYGAWVSAEWIGSIKPSTDPLKMAKALALAVDRGWITNHRAARQLNGTKFRRNVSTLTRENQLLVKMREPLLIQEAEFSVTPETKPDAVSADEVMELIVEAMEERDDDCTIEINQDGRAVITNKSK